MTTGGAATKGSKRAKGADARAKTAARSKPSVEARLAAQVRRRSRKRNQTWKRFLLRLIGWMFIFLGILGIFLPILQGILFLLIGMFILGRVSPRMRLWRMWARAKARQRYPNWTGKFEEAEVRAKYWINRILKNNRKKA